MDPESVQQIDITSDSVVIPEPTPTVFLAGFGLMGLMKRSRRRSRDKKSANPRR
jgi:hypothetical protein